MFDPWRFERFSGNGGSGARGLRRTLSGSGLKEAYRLGREIPQNSNDAAREPTTGVVRLTFRLEQCTGARRTALVQLLQAQASGPAACSRTCPTRSRSFSSRTTGPSG
jgi:hypothetical protein